MRLLLLPVLPLVARAAPLVQGVRKDGLVLPVRLPWRLPVVLRVRALVAVVLPRLLVVVIVLPVRVLLPVHAAVPKELREAL